MLHGNGNRQSTKEQNVDIFQVFDAHLFTTECLLIFVDLAFYIFGEMQ